MKIWRKIQIQFIAIYFFYYQESFDSEINVSFICFPIKIAFLLNVLFIK